MSGAGAVGATGAPGAVRVRIFYPADPLGTVPGGIETFIRGVIGWAPADIEVSVVGLTTDAAARPPGRWLTLTCRGRAFRHFPAFVLRAPGRQPRIPATLRHLLALSAHPALRHAADFDVAEVHRLEPVALLPREVPISAVLHQDSEVLRQRGSDIRWRHLPGLYFALERRLIRRPRTVFSVFEAAARGLRSRYPEIAERVRFTPTWLDSDRFRAPAAAQREIARRTLRERFALAPQTRVLLMVGRLESQKHPELAVEALARLRAGEAAARDEGPAALVFVGDGALRPRLEQLAAQSGVADRVVFAGFVAPDALPQYFHGADAFLLTSRYEGMPIALLEALATGLPAVASDVGEVARVVHDGRNGRLLGADARSPEAVAAAVAEVLRAPQHFAGPSCVNSVAAFSPERVLAPIYANYRRLAAGVPVP